MKTQKRTYSHSRSINSKLLKFFLIWFHEEPSRKRSRIRRSASRQFTTGVGWVKVKAACCWTFLFVLFIWFLVMRYSENLPISILKNELRQTQILPEPKSLNDMISDLDNDPQKHLKPNPASSTPSDWDLAFIETPRINLEAWAKSFESCFFEQKAIKALKFKANFYYQGKFIFMETLEESKRKYTKSGKVFNLEFGKKRTNYMHVEFQYDIRTQIFIISINGEFGIEFKDLAPEEISEDVIQAQDDNIWCNYDFNRNLRYHIACKTIAIVDRLKHTFDSFEFEFAVK